MLDRLLIRLVGLVFAGAGLVTVNDQVLDGALCLGTQGDRVVVTEGCILRESVDLPSPGEDIFGGALDLDDGPRSTTVGSRLP